MRICLCVSTYEMGGIGTVIYYESKYLQMLGYEVKIVTLNPKLEPPLGVDLIRLKNANEINELRCDIVHVHDGLQFLKVLKHDRSVVVTYHGYVPWHLQPTFRDMIMMPIYKHLYLHQLAKPIVKKVIVVSNYVSKDLVHIREKVVVIHNGVDINLFQPIKNNKIKEIKELMGNPALIYVGSFYKFKKVLDLVKAMQLILKEYNNSKLTLIGYGPSVSKIIRLAERFGICKHLNLLSPVSHKKLPLFYNAADVFVTASIYETFGLPILEAMACGKPVIARNIPAIAEHAEKAESILLFNKIDEIPELLKRALERYRIFSVKAYNYARTLSWKKHVNKLVEVYESI